jgi:chaperone required for assembly of F1-ATPase
LVQPTPKRFYSEVTVAPRDNGFAVLLDGKPVRTPARNELVVPNEAMAKAIAEEWRGQGETIVPDTMPMTRFVNTAIDRIAPRRDDAMAQIMRYAEHDLVCYRAEHPADLAARQARAWDPLLAWLKAHHRADLKIGMGIKHIEQSEKSLKALDRAVAAHDDFQLAALHAATTVTGSLAIGLAFLEGRLDAEGAFAAAHLDEAYQAERWGEDAEAQARARRAAAELVAAERFLILLKKS